MLGLKARINLLQLGDDLLVTSPSFGQFDWIVDLQTVLVTTTGDHRPILGDSGAAHGAGTFDFGNRSASRASGHCLAVAALDGDLSVVARGGTDKVFPFVDTKFSPIAQDGQIGLASAFDFGVETFLANGVVHTARAGDVDTAICILLEMGAFLIVAQLN